MKGRVVVLDHVDGRAAAALMVDGRLEDLIIDPPEDLPPAPGAIYRAKAERPMKGQGGVTLDLGRGQTGFLRKTRDVHPGDMVLVQVSGTTEAGKASPVTPNLLFKSRYAIVTPFAPGLNVSRAIKDDAERDRLLEIAHDAMEGLDYGLILRSACEEVSDADTAADITAMCELARQVLADLDGAPELLVDAPDAHLQAWVEWSVPDPDEVIDVAGSFETLGVLDAVEALLGPRVALSGQASAYIETTRALIAVDVNTGADSNLAAGLRANLGLVRDLPRQLRLRGLGGQVVLDLAPMPKKDRRQIEDATRRAFRQDGAEVVIAGWTPLGHLELQRKRDRWPLTQIWPT